MPDAPSPYLPGKAIVLSRLPARDWFTPEEAAEHSGWSRSFIRLRVRSGELPAQTYSQETGRLQTARIHVDDLVLFILRNSAGKLTDEKPFRDVATIVRTWPAWMRREMVKYLNRSLTPPVPGPEAAAAQPPPAAGADLTALDIQSTAALIAAVVAVTGVPYQEICGSRGPCQIARARFLAIAAVRRQRPSWTVERVAAVFRRSYTAACHSATRHEALLASDPSYASAWAEVCHRLDQPTEPAKP